MSAAPERSLPPHVWEAFAASLLLAWRAWTFSGPGLWRDWFAILCVFWFVTALGSKSRAQPYVTGAVMAALLLLYGSGQIPQSLSLLGWRS